MVDTAAGRARRAAWLYGAADALLQSLGTTGQVTFSRVQDRYLTLSRDAIGESAFREAYDAGRTTAVSRIMDKDPPDFSLACSAEEDPRSTRGSSSREPTR